jgi:hypothetical protein
MKVRDGDDMIGAGMVGGEGVSSSYGASVSVGSGVSVGGISTVGGKDVSVEIASTSGAEAGSAGDRGVPTAVQAVRINNNMEKRRSFFIRKFVPFSFHGKSIQYLLEFLNKPGTIKFLDGAGREIPDIGRVHEKDHFVAYVIVHGAVHNLVISIPRGSIADLAVNEIQPIDRLLPGRRFELRKHLRTGGNDL